MIDIKQFSVFSGDFSLERLPKTTKGDLRAWDAADELLLQHVSENHSALLSLDTPVLIINDTFGALAVGLNQYATHSWSDSYITHLATQENYALNQLDIKNCKLIPSTEQLPCKYKLVLIKIPKTLALLEEQLCQLKPHIYAETIIIASAMTKHIHNSTLKNFEKIIGTTTTSRATKKARLVFAENNKSTLHKSPYPKTISDESFDLTLLNHANVFAKDHLDIGTRFMLTQLKACPPATHILDLGCGNGALGVYAHKLQPSAKISFIDESYMAIASAQENTKKTPLDNTAFYISDSLNQVQLDSNENKPDLILCNPPFHQAHSIGDHIAWQMFKQSYNSLQKSGELWVVGNRHLAYHVKLKKLFGNCRTVAANNKFAVFSSIK